MAFLSRFYVILIAAFGFLWVQNHALAYVENVHVGEGIGEKCARTLVAELESDPDLAALLSPDEPENVHVELVGANQAVVIIVGENPRDYHQALFSFVPRKFGACFDLKLLQFN